MIVLSNPHGASAAPPSDMSAHHPLANIFVDVGITREDLVLLIADGHLASDAIEIAFGDPSEDGPVGVGFSSSFS